MDSSPKDAPKDSKRSLSEFFEKVWGQALATVSQAEEEAGRAVSRVSAAAGWSQDEVKRHARELSERLAQQRSALEKSAEEGVRKALTRVQLPRREELVALNARLDAVSKRVEALTK